MKTIGLIGGMSWESTVTYYQVINEKVKEVLGGLHSAKIFMYSVDFYEIEQYQAKGEWDKSAEVLGDAAAKLEQAGADYIFICTNTMHKIAPQVQARISVPVIHIAEATAQKLKEQKVEKVALLGTKYTMTQDFYKSKLIDSGIEVLIPGEKDVELVNGVIYDELCLGEIKPESKAEFLRIIEELAGQGAQGVILGCTEIGLLISQQDTALPVFDTTLIHGEKATMLAVE